MSIFEKIQTWWYLHLANPVVREGESGGFKWRFRRFGLEIETVSGNFKAKWSADEHPFAYLLVGKDDSNIKGFATDVYLVSKLLTTEPKFAKDIEKAIQRYDERLAKAVKVVEDEVEEKAALEFEKEVQEHLDLPEKERKKEEKRIEKEFKKNVKKAKKSGTDFEGE